jgi:RND family efflux transporter MFP subunit
MSGRFLTLAALAACLLGCSRREPPVNRPAPLVKVARVERRAGAALELRGSVAAQSRIRLGFKQSGVIAAVLVREGDRVAQGQLLARLDDVDAQASVRMALANREKAKRDAARASRLAEDGAVPTGTRDDAFTHVDAVEAQLIQAQDALARAQLLAPASGTVFTRQAEPGETVGAGAPVVVLDTTGAVVAKAGATERELMALAVGQSAVLQAEDGPPDFPGRITSLATTPNASDGLYTVEVTPASPRRLRPGTLLRMRFQTPGSALALRVPLEALVHRQDHDFVFVLEAGGRVRQQPIEIERAEDGEAVVRGGLDGAERVVAEGAYFLQDGQAVRVLD